MKTFLKAVVLAFLSMTVGVVLAHRAFAEQDFGYARPMPQFIATECGGMATEAEFFKVVESRKIPVRTFTDSGQKKIVALLNSFREKRNQTPLPADTKFYVGALNQMEVGVVLMSEGCVVVGSVETMPGAALAALTHVAKITEDEMIAFPLGDSI